MCVKLGLHVRSFFIRDKSIFKRKGSKTRCHNWSAGSYHTSFSSYKWNDMLTKWHRDKSRLQTQRKPTSLLTMYVHSILSIECQTISDLQSIHSHHEDPVTLLFLIFVIKFFVKVDIQDMIFYRTRVRSLAMLVTHWLTHSLTHELLFSKLYWCDPGVWRCQLKTCWGCYCCWCCGSCWQQFVTDFGADVWS